MTIFDKTAPFLITVFIFSGLAGCSGKPPVDTTDKISNIETVNDNGSTALAQITPSNKFTPADISKLKWIEGTWRGMGGEKPFFERYRFENGTTMLVETFEDEKLSKVVDTARFELIDGEFTHDQGIRRSAASSITETSVQFVPAPSRKAPNANGTPPPQAGGEQNQNNFRFERHDDGTWNAVLEWSARNGKPAGSKVYKMEPWPKK
jgi:hypothetical protein